MIRLPPRSTRVRSSAASDVYKRQLGGDAVLDIVNRIGHVVRPVHGLRLEAAPAVRTGFPVPVEDIEVVGIDAELAGAPTVFVPGPGVLRDRVQARPSQVESCLLYTSPSPRDRT